MGIYRQPLGPDDPFLERTAHRLYSRYGEQISSLTLVFPSRRAHLYFSEYLSQQLTRPLWQPKAAGMAEIFSRISGLTEANRYLLAAELYKSYKKNRDTEESFEHFYSWGEVMLADFDALDKYLVQVDPLLRNLAALKNIDSRLAFLSKAQRAAIQAFWKNFAPGENGRLQADFASLWSALLPTYYDLRQALRKKKLAYQGMIYREGAEALLKNGFDFGAERFVFIGFNALNECEKTLLRHLQQEQRAEFFWDCDPYYVGSKRQEAGMFMRQNLADFPPVDSDEAPGEAYSPFAEKKDIQVIATTSDVLQAKLLPTLLGEACGGEPLDRRTAIVLADEGLLIPTLYSLPPETEALNVTMGYPLAQTPMYSLVELLIRLHRGARKTENQPQRFYHKDVLALLQHQYIRMVAGRDARALCSKIVRQNRVYATAQDLLPEEGSRARFPVSRLFALLPTPSDFLALLHSLMQAIATTETAEDTLDSKLRREYVACAYRALNQIADALRECEMKPELPVFLAILRSALKSLRIPFEGEPVAGLQLMGILETRTLDFENLVILSLNDDVFPRGETLPSLIPYNLRRGFGLPTADHHEATYAYCFYRLLQRAKRVRLVYNRQGGDARSGEMSRYLRQLMMECPHSLTERSVSYSVTHTPPKPIAVEKTGKVAGILAEFLDNGQRAISASSINSYIACPLKFYFAQIARLREPEEVDEEVDGRTLGNIFHRAMQAIYTPFLGKSIAAADIEALLKSRPALMALAEAQTAKEIFSDEQEVAEIARNGKLFMLKETVLKYVEEMLRYDMRRAPFAISGLEAPVEHRLHLNNGEAGSAVCFKGYVDRVDALPGGIRIVDYKTGSSLNGKKMKLLSVDALFSEKEAERRPEILQTLLYSSILRRQTSAAAVTPMLLFVRSICKSDFDGSIKLKSGAGYAAVDDVTPLLPRFEELLCGKLSEMFDLALPFVQTSEAETCALCPYNEICHR